MNGLVHAHSGLRYVAIALLLFAIFNAFSKWKSGKEYLKKDKLFNLFAMVSLHIQATIGIILYIGNEKYKGFSAMGETVPRYYAIEHVLGMVLGIMLITMGRKKAEKANKSSAKFRKVFVWYTIGLIIILVSIPWPFIIKSAGWV